MRYKGVLLHLPKMMKPKEFELKAHIRSQIWNYEEPPQLITSLQASHAWVFRSMDVVVLTNEIPYIGTLTEAKRKGQVWLELDSYNDELTWIATNADLAIREDTMHQYVAGPSALKTVMHILSNELDRGANVVYPDATEERVHFQKDVTTKYVDTIVDYQDWHKFATINHHEDVEELVFPQFSESQWCLSWLTQAYFVSHGYMCILYVTCCKVEVQMSIVECNSHSVVEESRGYVNSHKGEFQGSPHPLLYIVPHNSLYRILVS